MKHSMITLALAISFLVAANVQAGLVTFYDNKDAYFANTLQSDWAFSGNITDFHPGGKDSFGWTFGMTNTATNSTDSAVLRFTNYNGNVNNQNSVSRPTVNNGLASFGDNSAGIGSMSFDADGASIGSFYFNIKAHSGSGVPFIVTVWDSLGQSHMYSDFASHVNDVLFFGFAFDEGVHLERFQIQALGNSGSNPGFWVTDMGFRGAAIPEPGTLAVLGLGLAGLGVARRRMKK